MGKKLPDYEVVKTLVVYYDKNGQNPRPVWGNSIVHRHGKGGTVTPQEIAKLEVRLEAQRQAEIAEYLEAKRAAAQRSGLKLKKAAKRKKAA